MSISSTRSTRVLIALAVAALLLTLTPGISVGASEPRVPESVATDIAAAKAEQVYIAWLADDPAVSYDGGEPGFRATAPGRGQKIDPDAAHVRRYVDHLNSRHDEVLRRVGAANRKVYDYAISFNGFAAVLNGAEAAQLEAMPDVLAVWADEARQPTTDNSPSFLGLDAEGGLWSQLGGQGAAGEDVIVGVIDTGIWPEHPSFDGAGYGAPPADWNGECVTGEQFDQNDCNNKLIGARYFRKGSGAAGVIPDDYLSPRDRDGHGTHTASTAAGNAGVQAEILGGDLGTVSGIAPRARVAAYKVCWNDEGCFLSDIVSAIDGAVADGVDVINYSIGGGPSLLGADDVAYLFAADAGVFVATSAGNEGPGAGTVGGPASVPWVTSVGASTQDRTFQGEVELGSGASFTGASVTGGTDVLTLVDSADVGSELCIPGELDSSAVSGRIVLCKRGEIARVDKSRAVDLAGGAGMVLYNENDAQSEVTDNHWVPSVHISNTDGLAIKDYIAGAGTSATAQITGGERVAIDAPSMAAFSSRGPNVVATDIIKPDVTAPGVNVLAGNSPNPYLGAPGQLFQAISGTSMASPHVAGAAALLRQAHPDWTPEMVKSALMTTAHQDVAKEDGSTSADPFDMGAGHIAPNPATNPGLVYEAGFVEYLQFLCGQGALSATGSTCQAVGGVDPSDLNLASIGVGDLAGQQTVARTVTNVGPAEATYTVGVKAPNGVDVSVSPTNLTLGTGETATYEVTFTTQRRAEIGAWSFGSLTWSESTGGKGKGKKSSGGAGRKVRSPIAVRPVSIAAPEEISGDTTSGEITYDVTFGYDGQFAAEPRGLVPANTTPSTVDDDPSNDINTALGTCDFSSFPFQCTGITWHAVSPGDAGYLRIALFDEFTDGADDLDLYVFDDEFEFVGSSGTPTSQEQVDIELPDSSVYFVAVHGWQTDGADANYDLFTWTVGSAAAGNMTVAAPSTANLAGSAPVTVSWSGLTTGTKYLGAVTYHNTSGPSAFTDGLVDLTVVSVSP